MSSTRSFWISRDARKAPATFSSLPASLRPTCRLVARQRVSACTRARSLSWATAWSFDRLRLWIEKGILPEVSRDRTFVYALSRLTVAFVWLYHGLVPKLIYRNPDELNMLHAAGIPNSRLLAAMASLGFIEVCVALVFVIFWKSRWPLWFTLIAMISAVLAVGITSPNFLTAAFNPVTLNLSVATLAVIGLLTGTDLPSASNCRRKSSEN